MSHPYEPKDPTAHTRSVPQTRQLSGCARARWCGFAAPRRSSPPWTKRARSTACPSCPRCSSTAAGSFRSLQRADKTCAGDGVVRRMHNTVHLRGLRCDGSAHGGCQAACLVFWKEAWLERVENDAGAGDRNPPDAAEESFVAETLMPATTSGGRFGSPRYRCQATEIPRASSELRFREVDQYVSDVRNWGSQGRSRPRDRALQPLAVVPQAAAAQGAVDRRWAAVPLRQRQAGEGQDADREARPAPRRPRSGQEREEIEATLDRSNYNRGLSFDGEMVRYCGRTARVRARVNRLVDEHTGRMIEINSDCIILEGVVCVADYHRFCPRAIYPYWREIWLERGRPADLDRGAAACAGRRQERPVASSASAR